MKRAILFMCLLASCDSVERNNQRTSEQFGNMPEIRYFRDHRVGLCFGYFYQANNIGNASTGGPALAMVPCDAVSRLLVNGSAP